MPCRFRFALAASACLAFSGSVAAQERALAGVSSSQGIVEAPAFQGPTVQSMLQEQVARCWKPPIVKTTEAEGGVARIRVALLPDGSLEHEVLIIDKPAGPIGLKFAESAADAVTRCAPFKLPPELYENWKDVMLHFDTITFDGTAPAAPAPAP